MSAIPAVLLKRSDGNYYRVHIGDDYQAVAKALSAQQAFGVSPMLICPCSSRNTANSVDKAIQTLCKPLQNSWFHANSNVMAATVLLQSLSTDPELDTIEQAVTDCQMRVRMRTPNAASAQDSKVDGTPEQNTDCIECSGDLELNHIESEQATMEEGNALPKNADVDIRLWDHVTACSAKYASKAADIRTALIQKLGKINAKNILDGCTVTVAKDSHGQKNRVLKANGKPLKLKQ